MAPKTPAERASEYRQRFKNSADRYEARKEKDKQKSKIYRANMGSIALHNYRLGVTQRTRKYRERLRTAQQLMHEVESDSQPGCAPQSPFATRQSMGKAIKRVHNALSHSPRKKIAVVAKIAVDLGLQLVTSPQTKQISTAITAETKNCVTQFYLRDDISRHFPGRKDVITTVVDGKKQKAAKRMLMYNLKEAHHIYQEENNENTVGLSKFCSLRPTEVYLVSSTSQVACCCPYCENIKLLFHSLKWKEVDGTTTKSPYELLTKVVCDPKNQFCMKGECTDCRLSKNITSYIEQLVDEDNEMVQIQVEQWDGGKLVRRQYSLEDIYNMLQEKLRQFTLHIFTISKQNEALNRSKQTLKEDTIIIQTDFAENYAIKYQNEVMAAHWTTCLGESATIYTAVVYYISPSTKQISHTCFAVISNTTKHRSLEVQVFNGHIFDHLKTFLNISFNHVHIWTDGAPAHFKNRYSMTALSHHRSLHSCTADWNFMESYHGKGPHDGVGAVVKYQVYRRVLQNREVVRSASDVFSVANKLVGKTVCLYVDVEEVKSSAKMYEDLWQNCKAIPGIQKCRYVKALGPYHIALYAHTLDTSPLAECNLEPHISESDSESDDLPIMPIAELNSNDSGTDNSEENGTPVKLRKMNKTQLHTLNKQSQSTSSRPKSKCVQSLKEALDTHSREKLPELNGFIISKFHGHHYVAQIMKIIHHKGYVNDYLINFMKKVKQDKIFMSFAFRETEDKHTITFTEIYHILPTPTQERLRFKWEWKDEYPSVMN